MPPLYTCELCNHPIDPSHGVSLRLASVWLKSNGKTVHTVEDELYRYRHTFCRPDEGKQDSLF